MTQDICKNYASYLHKNINKTNLIIFAKVKPHTHKNGILSPPYTGFSLRFLIIFNVLLFRYKRRATIRAALLILSFIMLFNYNLINLCCISANKFNKVNSFAICFKIYFNTCRCNSLSVNHFTCYVGYIQL